MVTYWIQSTLTLPVPVEWLDLLHVWVDRTMTSEYPYLRCKLIGLGIRKKSYGCYVYRICIYIQTSFYFSDYSQVCGSKKKMIKPWLSLYNKYDIFYINEYNSVWYVGVHAICNHIVAAATSTVVLPYRMVPPSYKLVYKPH